MILTIIIALFAAVGLSLLLWLLRGALLTPLRLGRGESLAVTLTVRGSDPGLENTVEALHWLVDNGTLPAAIILCDAGMDAETRQTAELLHRRGHVFRLEQDQQE